MKAPEDCQSPADVRAEIDRVDADLIKLFAERWRYVDRIWVFKREASSGASVQWRNEEVIQKVRTAAEEQGMPPGLAEDLWRMLLEWGIKYQEAKLGEK